MSSEKDSEFVTSGQLNTKLNEINTKIDTFNSRHEVNYTRLDTILSAMKSTFESLNHNIEKMVDNQEQTNNELKQLSITNAQHELRITTSEKRQDSLEAKKTAYTSDVMKLTGTVLVALLGLIGTVIGIAFGIK